MIFSVSGYNKHANTDRFNPLTGFKPLVEFFLYQLKRKSDCTSTAINTADGMEEDQFALPPSSPAPPTQSGQSSATGANAIPVRSNPAHTQPMNANNWQVQGNRGNNNSFFQKIIF